MDLKQFILIFSICQISKAAIKEGSYGKLQLHLKQQKEKVSNLRKQVIEIEESLSLENKKYIKGVKGSEELQRGLTDVNNQLEIIAKKMVIERNKIKTILKSYVLRSIDDRASSDDLYMDQVMLKGFLTKKKLYKKLKQDFFSLKSQANILKKRIDEYQENEKAILSLILDLEESKHQMTKNFIDNRSTLLKLKNDLAKGKSLKMMDAQGKEKSGLKMRSPLYSFRSLRKDKDRRGVVYEFSSQTPFYAGAQGQIQYLGRLANYGNLVIINHGYDIRSVLLGDIYPKVKKGQKVARGEIIGYTRVNASNRGELYFEVRVKNVAHNTLSWLERSSMGIRKI